MHRISALVLAFTFALAGAAMAQDAPPKQNCEAMKLGKPAFIKCYAANFAAANMALGNAYEAAMNHYGNDKNAIRDIERTWIAYKDKECAIENNGDATWKKNEDYGLRHTQCEIEKTEERIRELQILTCEGASLCYPHVY
ncbi:MAG: lysozyme inhibitor LprI family protein [Rhizomicrobium sp.]